jgi:hypothetical protein
LRRISSLLLNARMSARVMVAVERGGGEVYFVFESLVFLVVLVVLEVLGCFFFLLFFYFVSLHSY